MFTIASENPGHAIAIEALYDRAFGPQRHRRESYRLRVGGAPVQGLGFVAVIGTELRGAIRFHAVRIAETPTLLLGPVATDPECQRHGIGSALMKQGLAAARRRDEPVVLAIGDVGFLGRFGFTAVEGPLRLPFPLDAARFLVLELKPGALGGLAGPVAPAVGPGRVASRHA